MTDIVNEIKTRLLDIHDGGPELPWSEGYISALADHGIINDDEFDILADWILQGM